jgi:hypothetical protein
MPRPAVPALVLPLLALSAAAASAQDETPAPEHYGLRLEYREYRPTLTGEVQKGANGAEGDLIDVIDDLGIEDDRTFDARVTLKIKTGHKVRAGYMPIDYHGDQAAPRNFTFKDTTYFRADRVVTTVKGSMYSGDYEWEFYRGERAVVGALLGARGLDVDTVLGVVDQALREQDSVRTPIPVLGLTGRGYAGRLSFEAEFAGLTAGSLGSFYEFEGSARVHLSDRLAVQGGYRLLSLDAKDDPDRPKSGWGVWLFRVEHRLAPARARARPRGGGARRPGPRLRSCPTTWTTSGWSGPSPRTRSRPTGATWRASRPGPRASGATWWRCARPTWPTSSAGCAGRAWPRARWRARCTRCTASTASRSAKGGSRATPWRT